MGFRSDSGRREFGGRSGGRSGGFNRGFSGRREGGFRDRSSGGFGNRRPEMHDVICDKCGKECQVPFRPTGDKPVLCSDCFRKDGGASRDSSRREFNSSNSGSSSGISQEQFRQLNAKLDKIIEFLEQIEFEEEELGEEETEDAIEEEAEDFKEEKATEENEDSGEAKETEDFADEKAE